jgi:hypothetical protein
LFIALRRRETAKPLTFLDLMKECSTVAGTQGSGQNVMCHERKSLEPRKDNILKLLKEYSCFSRETQD